MPLSLRHLFVVLLWAGLLTAYADDDVLVRELEKKGYLTHQEAEEILNMDSVRVEPKGKHTEMIRISGLFQFQYNYMEFDDGAGLNPASRNNFQLRRIYLGVDASLGNGFGAIVMPNFGGGKVRLDHAYIYKQMENPDINLYAGLRKVRFNQEEYSSTTALRTIERSIVSGYWGNDTGTEDELPEGTQSNGDLGFAAQHMGLFAHYDVSDSLGMELSIVNGYAGESSHNAFQNSLGIYTQLYTSWDFAQREDERLMLTAGISAGYQSAGNSFWQPTDNGASTGLQIGNSDGTAMSVGLNPYFLLEWDGFILTGEFLINWIEHGKLYTPQQLAVAATKPTSAQAAPYGFIVTPSYRVSEDVELVFQYAYLNTDGRGAMLDSTLPNGEGVALRRFFDSAQAYYFGVNWYIYGNDLKVQLGYQYTEYANSYLNFGPNAGTFTGPGFSVNSIRSQLQLVF